ncbi:MAG: N-acetylmuramoyl-L-alanine amidase-like domain-containing protein [Fimbriimonadaceae bacterium]
MITLAVAMLVSMDDVQFVGHQKLKSVLAHNAKLKGKPMSEIVGSVARSFIDTPYTGWTLERNVDREFCFVTLDGLDCVTFFESSLAIANMIRNGEKRASDLVARVTQTRYRGGTVSGYGSRLHYTSDWIHENAKRGTIEDMSGSLPGSSPLDKKFSFMSDHADTYRQLKAHPELIEVIRREEARLTKTPFNYIPTASVPVVERYLHTGDIIGIVTKTAGMDCSHTGMIIREGSRARFLHASSVAKKVILDGPISDYLKRNEKSLGIMVARPK